MQLKTINILYWIFTIIFCGLMIFSSIGGLGPSKEAIEFLHDGLGYPVYFISFISWAKMIGAIVLLIPGLDRIKEWAYAGLFFDLAGAVYSGIAVSKSFDPMMLTLLLWILPGVLSYIFWNMKKKTVTKK